mgnify:CR=1 FL=1
MRLFAPADLPGNVQATVVPVRIENPVSAVPPRVPPLMLVESDTVRTVACVYVFGVALEDTTVGIA